MAPNTVVIHTF